MEENLIEPESDSESDSDSTKEKGIVKWLVEFFDESDEITGIATILTMVKKKNQ